MTASTTLRIASALALLFALCASPSWAEREQGATMGAAVSSGPSDTGWRYNSYYIYPLTRHMDESDIPKGWPRYALYPVTLALDTVQLPAGAVIGLFGH